VTQRAAATISQWMRKLIRVLDKGDRRKG
jgi:hypothetical protein